MSRRRSSHAVLVRRARLVPVGEIGNESPGLGSRIVQRGCAIMDAFGRGGDREARSLAPEDAGAYRGALAAVTNLTRPGEPVLFAPQLSALYVLSGRVDPLAQISLLPGALPSVPAEQQAIARLLWRRRGRRR